MTVDQIARPGLPWSSGAVTFSDGMSADWYLDQTGRLGWCPNNRVTNLRPPTSNNFKPGWNARWPSWVLKTSRSVKNRVPGGAHTPYRARCRWCRCRRGLVLYGLPAPRVNRGRATLPSDGRPRIPGRKFSLGFPIEQAWAEVMSGQKRFVLIAKGGVEAAIISVNRPAANNARAIQKLSSCGQV